MGQRTLKLAFGAKNTLYFTFLRGAVKNVLAENHFAKKPLAEGGVQPPPPLTENRRKKILKK